MQTAPREPRPALLTGRDVASMLTVSERTLEDWRLRGTGPELPYVRIGRSVRYRSADVQRLIESSVRGGGA